MTLLNRRLLVACSAMVVALVATAYVQPKTDEEYDKLMKQVGPANGALRKSLEASPADAAAQAQKLAALFKDVEAFWTGRKVTDAAGWAKTAMTHAQNIEKAIGAKDMAKATEELKGLGGMCQTCHTAYRDKGADGGFRIKPKA
jgi:cytochrome c556